LNLKIKDIHCELNYLMLKLDKIEKDLCSELLMELLKNFFESNRK